MPPSRSIAPGSAPASGKPNRPALRSLLALSRPRFWVYLAGPYAVGLLCGASHPQDIASWLAACFFLFFLFPANLFVYGVNDAHDMDTDALNAKKGSYEARLRHAERRGLLSVAWAGALPFAALSLAFAPWRATAALGVFLLLAHQYSAPPLRAKARPFVDSASNILYACPGFFAYFLLGGQGMSAPLALAAWCWCAAMHAYSAVPDIEADAQAGLATTATALGQRKCLLLCGGLYSLAALASWPSLGWLSPLLGCVYASMVALSLRAGAARGSEGVLQVYRAFPLLNTAAGFLLFWRVAWLKFAPALLAALASLHSAARP